MRGVAGGMGSCACAHGLLSTRHVALKSRMRVSWCVESFWSDCCDAGVVEDQLGVAEVLLKCC